MGDDLIYANLLSQCSVTKFFLRTALKLIELNGSLQFSGVGVHRPGKICIFDNTSSQTAPEEGALTPPGKKGGTVHSIPGRRRTTYRKRESCQRQRLLELEELQHGSYLPPQGIQSVKITEEGQNEGVGFSGAVIGRNPICTCNL